MPSSSSPTIILHHLYLLSHPSHTSFHLRLHSPPNPVHTFSKLVSTQTMETKATATPTPQPASTYHPEPPHASHVPLRQGARHWAPPSLSSPHPHRPRPAPPPVFAHAPQFHPSYLPPGLHHVLTKAANPKKRKGKIKKKVRIIQPLPCRTVLAQVPSFVPGPASPRLACPANTPSSPREQQPAGLGDGTGVWCYLKRYSLAPRMAPWSPADYAC